MKKLSASKLRLSTETLRVLDQGDLSKAVGGTFYAQTLGCQTLGCQVLTTTTQGMQTLGCNINTGGY